MQTDAATRAPEQIAAAGEPALHQAEQESAKRADAGNAGDAVVEEAIGIAGTALDGVAAMVVKDAAAVANGTADLIGSVPGGILGA